MGAWGAGPFDNDSACDWAGELADGEDDGPLADAFSAVLECGGYLDVDDGSAAVGAAQVLVVLAGKEGRLPPDLQEWVDLQPAALRALLFDKHRDTGLAALDRVRGANSELASLWGDGDDTPWAQSVVALVSLLRR